MSYARAPIASPRARLGSDDVVDSDPDYDAYLAWVDWVKAHRGFITTTPNVTVTSGILNRTITHPVAAAIPFDTVFPAPTYALADGLDRQPDDYNADSSYAYYIAPAAVARYLSRGAPVVPGASMTDQIAGLLRAGGWVLGGVVALVALSHLPNWRD